MSEQQPRPDLRASDEDRERLVADLREHAVAGRITTDELEQRAQAVYSATTTAELDALRRDLPMTQEALALSHTERRAHLTRRLIQETGGTAALFVVCTAIWLVGGASGQFWPVWVLIVVVLSLARNGWALFGPAPDLDAVEQHLNQRRERRLDRDHQRRRR
jgi:Domain of unknown function (DUF1707)